MKKSKLLPLGPVNINKEVWCYVEKKGLMVVKEERTKLGEYIATTQALVPWRAVSKMLSDWRASEEYKEGK